MTEPGSVDPLQWLLREGLVPLLGATVLYIAIRAGGWIMANPKRGFKFYLAEGLDPMGWLYGGAVLAFQTAIRRSDNRALTIWLILEGSFCLLLLLVAMIYKADSKAKNAHYEPDQSASWAAAVLVAGILYTGFLAYH